MVLTLKRVFGVLGCDLAYSHLPLEWHIKTTSGLHDHLVAKASDLPFIQNG